MMKSQIRSTKPQAESESRRSVLRRLALGSAAITAGAALSACGFKLRGSFAFAFDSMQVTGQANGQVAKALQASLKQLGIAVGSRPAAVGQRRAVVLNVVSEQRERNVASQSSSGEVQELALRQRFRYSLSTPSGRRLLEESELSLERSLTFSDSDTLSKEGEEQLNYEDMQSDAVQQVLRRLSAVTNI